MISSWVRATIIRKHDLELWFCQITFQHYLCHHNITYSFKWFAMIIFQNTLGIDGQRRMHPPL
jgi:hypothetical protein